MKFADGMAEAMEIHEGFADEVKAAAYWSEGIATVPTEELQFTGAGGQPQAARHFRGGDGPVVFYIHGGGWIGGSIDLNAPACHHLARAAGADVLSVSYRFAPEHPFPAGLEDCRAALHQFRPSFGDRPLVLAGASAGGNLAMALALDEPADGILPIYAVLDDDLETESHRLFGEGYGLDTSYMAEIFTLYDPEGQRATDPRVCPLFADDSALAALPPVYLVAAELDVLRDDTILLANRLEALGRPHRLDVVAGVTHGFINRARMLPAAVECLDRAAAFIRQISDRRNP